ncbi:MAG TPA: hypothetical protein VM843_05840 [Flavisolibacter sp.]|nr:hypothetical protein [Flavisolibacter sp.]
MEERTKQLLKDVTTIQEWEDSIFLYPTTVNFLNGDFWNRKGAMFSGSQKKELEVNSRKLGTYAWGPSLIFGKMQFLDPNKVGMFSEQDQTYTDSAMRNRYKIRLSVSPVYFDSNQCLLFLSRDNSGSSIAWYYREGKFKTWKLKEVIDEASY